MGTKIYQSEGRQKTIHFTLLTIIKGVSHIFLKNSVPIYIYNKLINSNEQRKPS